MSDTSREPLDPAEGSKIASETAQTRQEIEAQVSDGSLGLADLFEMSASEEGETHRVAGHIHLRAVLLALPHIGEVRADEILEEVGLEGDRHLDTIGSDEQEALVEAVQSRQPSEE